MDNDNLDLSTSETPDDVPVLPDIYNRELTKEKNLCYSSKGNDVEDRVGGYREWKTKNGMDVSERMVSSLGRALHNQGMVNHNNSGLYRRNHYDDGQSSVCNGIEYQEKCHLSSRLNASEPCDPLQSMRHQNVSDVAYRKIDPPSMRPESNGHYIGRPYQYWSRESDQHGRYGERCNNPQCCPNITVESQLQLTSPNQHGAFIHREHSQYNRSLNHQPHNESNYKMSEYYQEHRSNDQIPLPCRINHNPSNQNCHAVSPKTCHCCQSCDGTHRRATSPPNKTNTNKKTDSSIKKLYRILWLQNEQLGLLEKQVSKLIELNFPKSTDEKSNEPTIPSKAEVESVEPKKSETCDVGIMTDLPCMQCSLNEKKISSSESEEDAINSKPPVDESLTLHGVDIPVRADELSSPPVSMHIDIQDYQESSSSELDESDTSEEDSEPVGWTFYDNVVGQVNNILKTASKKKSRKKHLYKDDISTAMERLKHLRMAVPEYDTNNLKRVTFEEGLREQQINLRAQSEISMNFNALASKYLTSAGNKVQDISMCNVISSNTNMSMATMRYLERHQIINRDAVDVVSKKNYDVKSRKSRLNGEKPVTSKFLDITAIRQQPKLLPKDV